MIAGPGHLTFFNDAWMQKTDSNGSKTNTGREQIDKNKTMTEEKLENQKTFNKDFVRISLATEFSFNFESKMWENGEKKYDHKDLQFVSSVLTTGIEPGSNQECRQNLKDIIGFIRGWRNEEQLSMHFLSSDESDGCKNDSFVTASTLKPGAYACSSKDHTSRFDSRYIIKGTSEYRLEFLAGIIYFCVETVSILHLVTVKPNVNL